MHARPSATVSVLSQIGRAAFPGGSGGAFVYYLLQGFTFAILLFAANTSFQGFPRLAALLARDRFFPRQFVNLGDRLVYSNGIVVARGARDRADRRISGQRDLAAPPVRRRRLHRVHALAGRNGALLATARASGGSALVNGLGGVTTGS